LISGLGHLLKVLDCTQSATLLERWVRALSPEPAARVRVTGKVMKIHRAAVSPRASLAPGEVLVERPDGIYIGAADGALQVLDAQLEGKKRLAARDLVNGRALWSGLRVGD
jgi:methionyl-tRNA formyltransferase